MAIKWVIVEKVGYSGREAAIRGLSFESKEAAEHHRTKVFGEWRRSKCHVESRQIVADDTADRMTCQCCARPILANTGKIAHHGYERPGSGWQTSSCMGALSLPFEVSRERLGTMIEVMQARLERALENRTETAAERTGVLVQWKKRDREINQYTHHGFEFTRETFVSEEGQKARRDAGMHVYDFDTLLQQELRSMDYRIRGIEAHIAEAQTRYDGWKQTHKRLGVTWVRI